MASKLEVQEELKSPADKFWAAIVDSTELFPKIFPEQFESIKIIEGDGKSVGSVKLTTYGKGRMHTLKFVKEKIEVADEANKMAQYSAIDGDILSFYKTFRATLQAVPKEDGSLVKWSVEYEKVSDEVPDPDIIKEMAIDTFKNLDAYLLKN